jgi:hypothetical protein
LKSVEGVNSQIDIGLKAEYKDIVWTGLNYKINNDLSTMAALFGFMINDRFNIGYSLGLPTSESSLYYSGSHEFMLGIKLGN